MVLKPEALRKLTTSYNSLPPSTASKTAPSLEPQHAAVTEDMDDLQNTGFTDIDATLYNIMQRPLSKHGNYSGRNF